MLDPDAASEDQNLFALAFDGEDDHVRIAAADLVISGSFTVEAWVKPAGDGAGAVVARNQAGPSAQFALRRTAGGAATVSVRGQSVSCTTTSGAGSVPDGTWTHLALVQPSSGNPIIYVNGQLASQSACSVAVAASTNDVLVGAEVQNAALGSYFNGSIDEVRLWSLARSQAEIQATMAELLAGDAPGLVSYYRFDEGTGDSAGDLAGGRDGRLGSAAGPDDADPAWTDDVPF